MSVLGGCPEAGPAPRSAPAKLGGLTPRATLRPVAARSHLRAGSSRSAWVAPGPLRGPPWGGLWRCGVGAGASTAPGRATRPEPLRARQLDCGAGCRRAQSEAGVPWGGPRGLSVRWEKRGALPPAPGSRPTRSFPLLRARGRSARCVLRWAFLARAGWAAAG